MDLGDRLQRWWDRMRGYVPPTVQPGTRAPAASSDSTAARQINPVQAEPGQSLKLSVEGRATQEAPAQAPVGNNRYRETGFDPYSSTGGYGKPRGWDDVPRK